MRREAPLDVADQPVRLERGDRHVDRDRERTGTLGAPSRGLAQRLVEDPVGQRHDHPVALGRRQEAARRDQAALRVPPADERLGGPRLERDRRRRSAGSGGRARRARPPAAGRARAPRRPAPARAWSGGRSARCCARPPWRRRGPGRPGRAARPDRRRPPASGAMPTLAPARTSTPRSATGASRLATRRSAMVVSARRPAGVRGDDRELVAAEPGHHVARAHAAQQAAGDLDQQLVAGGVAERVVHPLELVEVDQEQRRPAPAPRRLRQLARQHLPQRPPVRQPGERVVHREHADPLLLDPPVGHVVGDPDHAREPVLLVPHHGAALGQPPHRAVGKADAVLDLVALAGAGGALAGLDQRPAVLGVDHGEEGVACRGRVAGPEAEQATFLLVPDHPVGGHVPVPGAHPAGGERQRRPFQGRPRLRRDPPLLGDVDADAEMADHSGVAAHRRTICRRSWSRRPRAPRSPPGERSRQRAHGCPLRASARPPAAAGRTARARCRRGRRSARGRRGSGARNGARGRASRSGAAGCRSRRAGRPRPGRARPLPGAAPARRRRAPRGRPASADGAGRAAAAAGRRRRWCRSGALPACATARPRRSGYRAVR